MAQYNQHHMDLVRNVNISSTRLLPTPGELIADIPLTKGHGSFVLEARETIKRILFGSDSRILVVVGPCSIHNVGSGMVYARRLKELADLVADKFYIVMRAYFEKPRTSLGWKGLIHDPWLDGSNDMVMGLGLARQFLVDLAGIGLPAATELIDPITPQYIGDLIAWSAVGARTVESQLHRQMASGLPMAIGFKNNTEGLVLPAIQAIKAARQGQSLMHITLEGKPAYSYTYGNGDCHLVLRGSHYGGNYFVSDIINASNQLRENGLDSVIMVDCSHGNSHKKHDNQIIVFNEVMRNLSLTPQVRALMLESNLDSGNQPFCEGEVNVNNNISITDPCISFEQTYALLTSYL